MSDSWSVLPPLFRESLCFEGGCLSVVMYVAEGGVQTLLVLLCNEYW